MHISYICPICAHPLRLITDAYACDQCGQRFPVQDGIPGFQLNRDYYFNPIPRDLMRAALARMKDTGWKAGLQEVLRALPDKTRPIWLRNVFFNGLSAWRFLLDVPPGAKALDFGCGWGVVSLNLARMCTAVVSLDLTRERLQFLRAMASEQGVDNITYVCGGDTRTLPFPSGSFDLVVLNGVLEWLPDSAPLPECADAPKLVKGIKYLLHMFGPANPKRMQLNALREIARVLAPAGQLYLAIENRYGYQYFLGKRDNHSNLLYSSLLPRLVAHAYSCVKNHAPYRTYTYSYYELRRLLRQAHFSESTFYSMLPSYHYFNEVSNLEDRTVLRRETATIANRAKRVLADTWLCRMMSPSFGIVASRSRRPQPFINALLNDLHSRLGAIGSPQDGELYVEHLRVTLKDVVVLKVRARSTGMGLLVRLPLSSIASEQVAANAESLRRLASDERIPSIVKTRVPAPVMQGVFRGQPYSVEELKQGVPATSIFSDSSAVTRLLSEVMDVIIALHGATQDTPSLDAALFAARVESMLGRVAARLEGATRLSMLGRIGDYLKRQLYGREVPAVFTIGDCALENILIDASNGTLTAVVDWDESDREGFPFIDPISLIEARLRERAGISSGRILTEVMFPMDLGQDDLALLDRYRESLGYTKIDMTPFLVIYCLLHIAHQKYDHILLDDRWIAENVDRVFSYVTNHIVRSG